VISFVRPAALACGLAGAIAAACDSSSTATTTHSYDAYDGGAYPNTRAKITLPAGADFALVPSSGSDVVTAVDLAKGVAIGSAPVGRSPVILDGPHQVVAHLPSRRAYVVHAYPGTLESAGNHSHGSSKRPGWVQALSLDDLSIVAEARVDPNPGEIAIAEDGSRVVVTHYDLASAIDPSRSLDDRRSTLALIDPKAMLPFGTPEPDKLLVCVAPHGLTLSRPDAKKAFVACYGEDAVAVVDLVDTHAPVVRVPVGEGARSSGAPAYGPYGVALSPDGSRLAIGSRDAHDVRFLDVATSAIEARALAMPGEVYVPAWSHDGNRLFVPTRSLDALAVIDSASGAQLALHVFDPATCIAPIEAAGSTDGTEVYVVCEGTSAAAGSIVTLALTEGGGDGGSATLVVKSRAVVGLFPGRPFLGRAL